MTHNDLGSTTLVRTVAITLLCLLVGSGCGKIGADLQGIPRPSDARLVGWLNGQKVVYSKGIFSHSYWTIETGEVSNFAVLKITKDPNSGVIAASVRFRATAGGRGIEVKEAIIRYKKVGNDELLFVEFVPISFSRIGN